ncbi:MAG: DUF2891 domain-containing protein [Planctomycetaceae bacterium]
MAQLAEMPLGALLREFPNKVGHLFYGAGDVGSPRVWTPAFFGCFDWHSAVHGHWCLLRLMREYPDGTSPGDWQRRAIEAMRQTLTPENITQELAYRDRTPSFEVPYGTAWLLMLAAELRERDPSHGEFLRLIEPLENRVIEDHFRWLTRLTRPIRTGEHNQTAFALGLTWDWAVDGHQETLQQIIEQMARAWYGDDHDAAVRFEPSGHDFLSPILAEADLMRRVLPSDEFCDWFDRFLPSNQESQRIDYSHWLRPVTCPDQADGKLAHLDGLNLSRAWMLKGIRSSLAESHRLAPLLEQAMTSHVDAGIAGLQTAHYAGTHWLATFATYLLTRPDK